MSVLNVRATSDSQLEGLSKLFDDMVVEEFESLPGMADCPSRRRLDDGIS